MNKKIILAAALFTAGLGLLGAALRPVHHVEPKGTTIVLPEVVIAADPIPAAPVSEIKPTGMVETKKTHRAPKKTAQNDTAAPSSGPEMMHVVGLPHPVVDQIHPSKPEHLSFDVIVQL